MIAALATAWGWLAGSRLGQWALAALLVLAALLGLRKTWRDEGRGEVRGEALERDNTILEKQRDAKRPDPDSPDDILDRL